LIAAGVLHDVLEKTRTTEEDLRRKIGLPITQLVLAVSDDDRITSYATRKSALRRQVSVAGDEALMLFAADKLSKVRELRREQAIDSQATVSHGHRPQLRSRRVKHYQRSLALLEERLPNLPLVRELRNELGAVLKDRPALAQSR
jgi:pantothenate kinase-related protein Tda10